MHNSAITNQFGGEFLWQGGTFRKGGKSLAMHGGTHAVVYCAKGSHGMWPDPGRHVYTKIPNGDTLIDEASSGLNWYIWENLKPVQYNPSFHYSGEFKFLGFLGRWGNRKDGCHIFGNLCQLDDGPTGPLDFPNVG